MYEAKGATGAVGWHQKVAIAAAGGVLVALVAVNLLPETSAPFASIPPATSSAAAQVPVRHTLAPIVVVSEPDNLMAGRNSLVVDGVRFSVDVPPGWESFGPDHTNYISRSETGPQGAEAVILWTPYPGGGSSYICTNLQHLPGGASTADIAKAAASVPGTVRISGPTNVALGNRPAKHVALTVRGDVGCDPGFFFTYANTYGGALWPETVPGDTIRVWIVDLDTELFWVQGSTHAEATDKLVQEIEDTIDSIRFD
jgi:hypothetical protein